MSNESKYELRETFVIKYLDDEGRLKDPQDDYYGHKSNLFSPFTSHDEAVDAIKAKMNEPYSPIAYEDLVIVRMYRREYII